MSKPSAGPDALEMIYLSLALGVFLYAAVVLFVLDPPVAPAVGAGSFRLVWLAVAVAATLGTGIVRGRMTAAGAGAEQWKTAAIIAWALGEGQALVGITGTLLTGDRVTAWASLALFAWLWIRYPPRAFERD